MTFQTFSNKKRWTHMLAVLWFMEELVTLTCWTYSVYVAAFFLNVDLLSHDVFLHFCPQWVTLPCRCPLMHSINWHRFWKVKAWLRSGETSSGYPCWADVTLSLQLLKTTSQCFCCTNDFYCHFTLVFSLWRVAVKKNSAHVQDKEKHCCTSLNFN